MVDPLAEKTGRPLIRVARAAIGWPLLLLGLYFLAGWIGSSLPRNADWREPEHGFVEIMVGTNGVHTEIVMPRITAFKDWTQLFPASDLGDPARPNTPAPYTHVSVSWGEREIFLGTPSWADLSPLTVARIVVTGGSGLLHVAHYVRPAPSETFRPLRISHQDYRRLVRSIERSLPPATRDDPRKVYRGYTPQDVFYDALGTYTPILTCNQWTSNRLAEAGIRTGRWTPFAGGVMKWVPEADVRPRSPDTTSSPTTIDPPSRSPLPSHSGYERV